MYERERDVAVAAIRSAARICRAVQQSITSDVLEKDDRSPVTVADFASQAVICRALAAEFPDDPIIDEEDAAELRKPENAPFLDRVCREAAAIGVVDQPDQICRWIDHNSTHEYSDRFWTLDPIDGTKGFVRKEQYAIALALIVDGRIALSLLGCPNLTVDPETAETGALFYAIAGEGAWRLPLDGPVNPAPVRVSITAEPGAARFCEPFESGHSSHGQSAQVAETLGITRPPLRLDSQAKYAVVARGEADIYMRMPSKSGYQQKIWDHAGGVLLVEEAGGRVTDVDGKPLEWNHGHELTANRGLVVTNGLLHDPVLAALRQAGV